MATETTRPESDVLFQWTPNGGPSTAWECLDDDPLNDSTYISEGTAGDETLVICGEPSPPAGSIMKQVRIRARMNRVFSSVILSYEFVGDFAGRLFEASGGVGVTNASPSTVTLATMVPGGSGSADPQFALIYVGGGGILVRELYVDWTYVALPVVNVTSPSGSYSDRNRVTAEWSETLDSDGGAQTAYRVKIFDSATYGGGSFDPETSTPDYDSGQQSGSATSHEANATLANDSYRMYVKVAQTVNGEFHWSEWNYEAFTIAVTAPATPTIVASPDDANARNSIVVTEGTPAQVVDLFQIQRSEDGGTTWENIRTDLGGGEILVAPTVVARSEYEATGNSLTHSITFPVPDGGLREGDVLMAFVGMDGNNTMTWSTGWVELEDGAGNGSAVRKGVAYYRITEDNETGSLVVTLSGTQAGAIQILAIRNAHATTAPDAGTAATGSSANTADPPSFNPGAWATENTLWIASMVIDSNEAVTVAPSGYYGFQFSQYANDTDGAGVATAYRRERVATGDPGAFTHVAEDWRATTFAVRPIHSNLTEATYDYEATPGVNALYRARAITRYATGSDVASDWSATNDAQWEIGDGAWLKHPTQPELNIELAIISRPNEIREFTSEVHKVLGSEIPIVVTDTRMLPSGEIVLDSETVDVRDDLTAILDTVSPLLLQFPADWDEPNKWVVFTETHDRTRASDKAFNATRIETLSYQEVGSPSAD